MKIPKTLNRKSPIKAPYSNEYLNRFNGLVEAWGLRKLVAYTTNAIRARRTGDYKEQNIGFVGNKLDTASLLAFALENQLAGTPLGVDANEDGVSDGWDTSTRPGATSFFDVSGGEQRIDLLSSSTTNTSVRVYQTLNVIAGEDLYAEGTFRVDNGSNVKAFLIVDWLDSGSGYLSSSEIASSISTTDVVLSGSVTAPASAAFALLRYQVVPVFSGATGSMYCKNAVITNSNCYVTTVYGQKNGLDAIQSAADKQPRIVTSGVVETQSDGSYAMYFDGSKYLDIADDPKLDITTGGVSIASNFDPDASGYTISRNLDSANNNQYGQYSSASTREFYLNGVARSVSSDTDKVQKVWASTYDHVNAINYKDGVLEDSAAYDSNLTSEPNMQIGCRSASPDGTSKAILLTGHIRCVIVFNTALSQTQITTLSNNL